MTASQRNDIDQSEALALGTACTRVNERVLCALGVQNDGAITKFENCVDVNNGGVLLALPALLENGLLDHLNKLGKVSGYYRVEHILLTIAFMLLSRIININQLYGYSPGELGKLVGLDRIPEGRCLRKKLDEIAQDGAALEWSYDLFSDWLEPNNEEDVFSQFIYIDGHVKTYNGEERIPRRYVSRERLCLRAISNCWLNDARGNPLFFIEKQIDKGLINNIKNEVVPRLMKQEKMHAKDEELEKDPLANRTTLVFDREGYSPKFYKDLWEEFRISILSYRKSVKDRWKEEEFYEVKTVSPQGKEEIIKIAERGVVLGKKKNKKFFWVREIRKLNEDGHQTSIITTDYKFDADILAPAMFARWCQENYFAYAMKHFGIDLLREYGKEEYDDTVKVINPQWREQEKTCKNLRNKLARKKSDATILCKEAYEDPLNEKIIKRNEKILESIEALEKELEDHKALKKEIPKEILWKDLPDEEKFMKLSSSRRRLINTICIIAYRAETAMMVMLKDYNIDSEDLRKILQDLYKSTIDIYPDETNKELKIKVHAASVPKTNEIIKIIIKS